MRSCLGDSSAKQPAKQLFRLGEQPLKESFATLFQRNLYTLAIGLAQSRGAGQDDVADIYKRCALDLLEISEARQAKRD